MKVLQTLGVYGATQQAGIFQYFRGADGVHIDCTVGLAAGGSVTVIENQSWSSMLRYLGAQRSVYDLGSLRGLIEIFLSINSSVAACVVAILEHEGSFDHYGGVAGVGSAVKINLRRGY